MDGSLTPGGTTMAGSTFIAGGAATACFAGAGSAALGGASGCWQATSATVAAAIASRVRSIAYQTTRREPAQSARVLRGYEGALCRRTTIAPSQPKRSFVIMTQVRVLAALAFSLAACTVLAQTTAPAAAPAAA